MEQHMSAYAGKGSRRASSHSHAQRHLQDLPAPKNACAAAVCGAEQDWQHRLLAYGH